MVLFRVVSYLLGAACGWVREWIGLLAVAHNDDMTKKKTCALFIDHTPAISRVASVSVRRREKL